MSQKHSEIESVMDTAIEDIIEIAIAGNFTKITEIEYALDYLKRKIDEIDPEDFVI